LRASLDFGVDRVDVGVARGLAKKAPLRLIVGQLGPGQSLVESRQRRRNLERAKDSPVPSRIERSAEARIGGIEEPSLLLDRERLRVGGPAGGRRCLRGLSEDSFV